MMLNEKHDGNCRASADLPVNSSSGTGSNIATFCQRAQEVSLPSFSCSVGSRPSFGQEDSNCSNPINTVPEGMNDIFYIDDVLRD